MLVLLWSSLGTSVLLAGYWFFYGSSMKSGLVILWRILCCGRWKQQGLNKGPQRGSLRPAARARSALPCPALPAALTLQAVLLPQPWPVSTRATGGTLRSLGGCIRIPRLSWRPWPGCLPAGLLLSPGPRNVTLGERPHLPSPLLCWVTTSTWETAPAFKWNRTPCSQRRWPDVVVFTSSAGPGRGIVRPPKRPAPPVPPRADGQPGNPAPAPSVAWEMPIGQICCCRRKTKPLASHAAGDKRERARERPRGGPSGTMAILSGAGDGRPDKGARCPQTPAAASAQNRGEQIWFLSSKSS